MVNVLLGGRLRQHMELDHRHVVHPVGVRPGSLLAEVAGVEKIVASCYHHQCASALGEGLVATAHAGDGTVEAAELAGSGVPDSRRVPPFRVSLSGGAAPRPPGAGPRFSVAGAAGGGT
ncbi:gamma-glutamyl-gamma-aminobutyrate hydrolase family protein [Streptosporangium roseum]|uniref:gamma-glutamyl-gamma-aminobutyrate hydrolase family protein n=1 Tax=Streptosporangium roseum TaxID=2001 RepID=UPI0033310136